jgi:hypothetical protein
MDLRQLTGEWSGHSSLWLRPDTPAFESATSASIRAVAGGRVLALEYTWTHESEPQDGLILLAQDDTEGVQMAWCDSYHMGTKIMDLAGGEAGDEMVAATGSYQFPDTEPWGWRIELEPRGTQGFQLRMFNLLPSSMGGIEALAVRGDYMRA